MPPRLAPDADALVEIDDENLERVVGLLAEVLAEEQPQDEDEQQRHADEQPRRHAVAQ